MTEHACTLGMFVCIVVCLVVSIVGVCVILYMALADEILAAEIEEGGES